MSSPINCNRELNGRNRQPPLGRGWGIFRRQNGEFSNGVDIAAERRSDVQEALHRAERPTRERRETDPAISLVNVLRCMRNLRVKMEQPSWFVMREVF